MPCDTAIAEELQVRHSGSAPSNASPKSFLCSRAIASMVVFVGLLLGITCFTPHKERVEYLVRKQSADVWCPRFEHFLCSSAKPKILLLSSSVGFVPSMMCDIKEGDVQKPRSVIQLQELSTTYESPAFLLSALRAHGLSDISAAHMGIPTANISDLLLLLRKSLAYGKKPNVLILPVNIRDFLMAPNWPAIDKADAPIKQALGDIPSAPRALSTNRWMRELLVHARLGYLGRVVDDARFYLAYRVYHAVRTWPMIETVIGQSDVLRNRMVAGGEVDNHYDAKVVGDINMVKLDPKTQNDMLSLRNKTFEDRQYDAFKQIVALTEANNIKLIIAKVPLYPGMKPPADAYSRYAETLTNAQSANTFLLRLNDRGEYSEGDYIDLLHLNGIGGERLFWRIASFVADHKAELFK